MAADWLLVTLRHLYDDALDSLEAVIRDCPASAWRKSMWEVRMDDRHVWPIVAGVGADLPDRERLQLHSAFWVIAYHVTFFLDHYLGGGVGPPAPPPPFRGSDQDPHTLPDRVYTREELLDYVAFCRRKAEAVLGGLTPERLAGPARIGQPFGEVLIRNLIQVTGHVEQMSLFLNGEGWSDSRWTTADRWFRRCDHCAPGP